MKQRADHTLGIYCPGRGVGGPWRYVHSLLHGIDPAEFNVKLYCDLDGPYEPLPWVEVINLGQPAMTIQPMKITATNFAVDRRHWKMRTLIPQSLNVWAGFTAEARKLAKVIRRNPVDLFHTQNTGCEESPVAARLAGVARVIGTFHVDSTYDLSGARSGVTHRLLEHVSNRCLDVGIAVSYDTRRDWMQRTGLPARRVVTIHNGIDPNQFSRRLSLAAAREQLGLPTHAILVGAVGRLDEVKGFEYLLAAAARVRSEFPNLCIVLAGEGPLRETLERQAQELGMAGHVRFVGFQRDVQLVLDARDVFVLPSLCEALGYALLEAMSAELPAIATSVGGMPEVIDPGKTGFLVPPRDPERLAMALRELLRQPDLRRRMGTAGRERIIQKFQVSEMVRRTIQVYREVLGARHVRRAPAAWLRVNP